MGVVGQRSVYYWWSRRVGIWKGLSREDRCIYQILLLLWGKRKRVDERFFLSLSFFSLFLFSLPVLLFSLYFSFSLLFLFIFLIYSSKSTSFYVHLFGHHSLSFSQINIFFKKKNWCCVQSKVFLKCLLLLLLTCTLHILLSQN